VPWRDHRNYRILTPRFAHFCREFSPFQLPVFDASEKAGRFQKTGNKMDVRRRRQNPVVGFIGAVAKMEASKTGSSEKVERRKEKGRAMNPAFIITIFPRNIRLLPGAS